MVVMFSSLCMGLLHTTEPDVHRNEIGLGQLIEIVPTSLDSLRSNVQQQRSKSPVKHGHRPQYS